jgi:beta-lactamase regulating signal transducer with metallopeptidase domain
MNADVAARLAEVVAQAPPALLGLIDLLLKVTLLLVLGLALDLVLRRRRPLAAVTIWNALLAAIVVLPAAHLFLPKTELATALAWRGPPPADQGLQAIAIDDLDAAAATPAPDSAGIVASGGELLFENRSPYAAAPETASPRGSVAPPDEGHASVVPDSPSAPRPQASAAVLSPRSSPARRAAPVLDVHADLPLRVPMRRPWGAVAIGAYLLGFVVAAYRLAAGLRAVARLRRESDPLGDEDWQRGLAKWTRRLGLDPRRVDLRTAESVNVPLVVGMRRPTVVVPREVARGASAVARDAILVHELAHVARADYAWHLLLRGLQTVLWFHPLIWYVGRRIHYVRERVCDAYSVHGLGSAEQYADVLLEMASRLAKRCSLGLGLAVVRSSKLGERLSAIYERGGHDRCAATLIGRTLSTVTALGLAALVGRMALAQAVDRGADRFTEAERIMETFRIADAAAMRETTRQLDAVRERTIARLQSLQNNLTRAGNLDGAVAVREQIRVLQSDPWRNATDIEEVFGAASRNALTRSAYDDAPAEALKAYPDAAGSLTSYQSRLGEQFDFRVTGSTQGSIWGTDLYSHDSVLAVAAVHAGLLQVGQSGIVRVTILKGPKTFAGSTRHGVASGHWSNEGGVYSAYRVERSNIDDVGVEKSIAPTGLSYGTANAGPVTVSGGTLRLKFGPQADVSTSARSVPGTGAILPQPTVTTRDSEQPAIGDLRHEERAMLLGEFVNTFMEYEQARATRGESHPQTTALRQKIIRLTRHLEQVQASFGDGGPTAPAPAGEANPASTPVPQGAANGGFDSGTSTSSAVGNDPIAPPGTEAGATGARSPAEQALGESQRRPIKGGESDSK